MNEQRRQVLQMLVDQTITADEAEGLIAALERDRPAATAPTEPSRRAQPKYLRVVVNSPDNFGGDGPGRVDVRVPLQLLRAGVQLTSLIPPQALAQVNVELDKSGVPIDLGALKPQQIEELIDQLGEVTVDVDQPEAKVQVFCE